jgi:hypothetical protein
MARTLFIHCIHRDWERWHMTKLSKSWLKEWVSEGGWEALLWLCLLWSFSALIPLCLGRASESLGPILTTPAAAGPREAGGR